LDTLDNIGQCLSAGPALRDTAGERRDLETPLAGHQPRLPGAHRGVPDALPLGQGISTVVHMVAESIPEAEILLA